MDPLSIDPSTRLRTSQMYEGLVGTDADLRPTSALAEAWGTIDSTTWEFTLRAGVRFHDGTTLTSDDVVSSLDRARKNSGADLTSLLASIDDVVASGPLSIRIRTLAPDPLLLRKLRMVVITSPRPGTPPSGTGPFRFVSQQGADVTFERWEQYWGDAPQTRTLIVRGIPNRADRVNALGGGEIDILTAVPGEYVAPAGGPRLHARTGLALTSLVLNRTPLVNGAANPLASAELRRAIALAIDRHEIEDFAPGTIQAAWQLVPTAVTGYDPKLAPAALDLDEATRLVGVRHEVRPVISLSIDPSLQKLGEVFQAQLYPTGISLVLDHIGTSELTTRIANGGVVATIVTWSFDTADPQEVLTALLHTQDTQGGGELNGFGAGSESLDVSIEAAATTLDARKRRAMLVDILREASNDDVIIPLYESLQRVVVRRELVLQPRLDGLVLAAEVTRAAPSSAP